MKKHLFGKLICFAALIVMLICIAAVGNAEPVTTETEHSWVKNGRISAPTCDEPAVYEYECTICHKKEYRKEGSVDPDAHEWGAWTETDATCTKDGKRERVCTLNPHHKQTQVLPALGHKWGEWTTTKEATCTEKGTQTRTCDRCSEKQTKEIAALGHKWGEWTTTKKPTCTEKGTQTRTCDRCGKKETKDIAAIGHKWDDGKVTKKATWTEHGEMLYTCKNDSSHTKTVKLDTLAKPNNIVCAFGPRLRDSSTILYPNVSDLWYMFTPFSVQAVKDAPGSRIEYDLVASNTDIVGKLTLSVVDDESLVVDYTLASNTIKITYEFFTILHQVTDLPSYEPENLRTLAMQRRQPINIEENFEDDDQLVLYFCSRCNYSYSPAFKPLAYDSALHQQMLTEMLSLID